MLFNLLHTGDLVTPTPARLIASLVLLVPLGVGVHQAGASSVASPEDYQVTPFQRAALVGERVEIPERADEYTTSFANPDGTVTTELSSVPVRARAADGSWVDVDYTLRREGARVVPSAATADMSFSGGGDRALVELESQGERLSLAWLGTLPAPVLLGPTATYRDVLPGVDLLMTAVPEGYTQLLRVRTPEAAANPVLDEIRFPTVLSDGTRPVNSASGGFEIVDAAGEPVFSSAESRMWDSSGAESSPANRSAGAGDVSVEEGDQIAPMEVTASAAEIAVTPDQELLQGVDTVYPVFIDPHVETAGKTEWTMVQKEYPGTEFYKWTNDTWGNRGEGVGYQNDQGISTKRLIWEYDISPAAGIYANATIVEAHFRLPETHSWSCTKSPVYLDRVGLIGSGTNWSNQPAKQHEGHLASTSVQVRPPDGGPDDCKSVVTDVTFKSSALVGELQSAVTNGVENFALRLSATESSEVGWKRFHNGAVLSITQNREPWKPYGLHFLDAGSNKTCDDVVAAEKTALPTLAGYMKDPDDDRIDGQFKVRRYNREASQWVDRGGVMDYDAANGGISKVSLAGANDWLVGDGSGGVLGGHYLFTMQTKDTFPGYGGTTLNNWGPVSDPCHFYLDTDDPKLTLSASIKNLSDGSVRQLTDADEDEWLKSGHELTFRMDPSDSTGASMGPKGVNDVDKYVTTSDVAALIKTINPAALGASATLTEQTANLAGEHWLKVKAYDEAGRVSDEQTILFRVIKAVETGRYEFEPANRLGPLPDTEPDPQADPVFTASAAGVGYQTGSRNDHLLLDGTGGLTAAPAVSARAAFSVSAWVRAGDISQRRVILSQSSASGTVFELAIKPGCGAACAEFKVSDPATGVTHIVTSTARVTASAWTVVAGSFDDLAQTHRIRVWTGDSEGTRSMASKDVPGFLPGWSTDGATRIGFVSDATQTGRWVGDIDDVRFYTDEVAAFDVQEHINTDNPASW